MVVSKRHEEAMNKPVNTHKPHATLPLGMERRNTPRFGCDRGVQCWKDGTHTPIWGTFINLSVAGCSIQTPTPLSPGARLSIVFNLHGSSIRISGVVRALHGTDMGIAFAAMTECQQNSLRAMVQRLADGRDTGSEVVMNTQAAVRRLERWFQEHDLLTRAIFERILDGSFNPAFETSAARSVQKAEVGLSSL
jgi:PilZ domain-containing protein